MEYEGSDNAMDFSTLFFSLIVDRTPTAELLIAATFAQTGQRSWAVPELSVWEPAP